VHGTVNDLAMCGAQPLALSAGLILEEGLLLSDLSRIVASMQAGAAGAGGPGGSGPPPAGATAALNGLVAVLLGALGEKVHVLRDPTRGGVASTLHEIATQAGGGIRPQETRLPIGEEVRGACEILGLDPLY